MQKQWGKVKSRVAHSDRSQIQEVHEQGAFSRFEYAIPGEQTRKKYTSRLGWFFDFSKVGGKTIEKRAENFLKLRDDSNSNSKIRDLILNFMNFHVKRAVRKEISKSTIGNYYKPVKLFCEMNDIILNWRIISRGIPSSPPHANDRIPTLHEISEVLKYPDRRIKPIVYTMISSGIRVGAFEWLKWKNITPVYDENKIVTAAKIILYDDEPEQYFSFITPEAYSSLEEWMEFRQKQGEKITGDSYIMRDIWNTGKILLDEGIESNLNRGTSGMISVPRRVNSNTIRQIFTRAWKIQNIREPDKKRKHEFKSTHCFRKYFETHALKSMKLLNVKMLMGHDTGLERSYYKPTEEELLQDYLNVVDLLTVNEENRLKLKVNQLTERQDEIVLMKHKHEKQMKDMQKELEPLLELKNTLIREGILEVSKELKE